MDKKTAIRKAKEISKSPSRYMRVNIGYHAYVLPFSEGQKLLKALTHAHRVRINYSNPCDIETHEMADSEVHILTSVQYEAIFLSQLLQVNWKEAISILENPDAPDDQ